MCDWLEWVLTIPAQGSVIRVALEWPIDVLYESDFPYPFLHFHDWRSLYLIRGLYFRFFCSFTQISVCALLSIIVTAFFPATYFFRSLKFVSSFAQIKLRNKIEHALQSIARSIVHLIVLRCSKYIFIHSCVWRQRQFSRFCQFPVALEFCDV